MSGQTLPLDYAHCADGLCPSRRSCLRYMSNQRRGEDGQVWRSDFGRKDSEKACAYRIPEWFECV